MSREEIAACAGQGCELEVFVHGALCMCVSGQCLLSAALGGRSGNRGMCAQPCRLPFRADRDGSGVLPGEGDADLSLKDLSLRRYVDELAAMGVASLKIEGRMKRPEYVAAAVSTYAAAVRQENTVSLEHDLQAVFSRSGFTDGYYTSQRGGAMFGFRRWEDVQAAAPGTGPAGRPVPQGTPSGAGRSVPDGRSGTTLPFDRPGQRGPRRRGGGADSRTRSPCSSDSGKGGGGPLQNRRHPLYCRSGGIRCGGRSIPPPVCAQRPAEGSAGPIDTGPVPPHVSAL